MKYWKGVVSILCMLSLGACTLPGTEPPKETKTSSEETSKKETETRTEPQEEKPGKTAGRPHLYFESEILGRTSPQGDTTYYVITNSRLYLSKGEEKKFPGLQKALEGYNQRVDRESKQKKEEMEQEVADALEHNPAYFDEEVLSDETTGYVMRADETLVSVLEYRYIDGTSPRADYGYAAYNYDTATGQEIKFTDVVKDTKGFFDLVDDSIQVVYPEDYPYMTPPVQYGKEQEAQGFSDLVWTMNTEGVTLYFNLYTLGEHALGTHMATVYFDDGNGELFHPKYSKSPKDGVFPLLMEAPPIDLPVSKDWETVPVVVVEQRDEDGYAEGFTVHAGENSVSDLDGYSAYPYIVKKDGQYNMYLFVTGDSDYREMYFVDLENMSFDERKDRMGISLAQENVAWKEDQTDSLYTTREECFTDPDSFMAAKGTFLIQSLYCKTEYHTAKDGRPVPYQEDYIVAENVVLRTLMDLPCKEVDREGGIIGEATIPANSYVLFLYTDCIGWIDVRILEDGDVEVYRFEGMPEDMEERYHLRDISIKHQSLEEYTGKLYRIPIEKDGMNVNGMDAEEVFQGILNAG